MRLTVDGDNDPLRFRPTQDSRGFFMLPQARPSRVTTPMASSTASRPRARISTPIL